jgi:hypothetical protein
MKSPFAERLWPACISGLKLDRHLLGELPEEEEEEVRAHLAGCARCSEMIENMRPGPLPPLRVVQLPVRPRRTWLRRAVAAGAGLAAAASLLLVLRPAPGERSKGPGFSLSMYVQHGADVRRAAPGEAVAAGDAVRFAVNAPVATYLAVLSVDARGRASVYFPLGPRAELVAAGADTALPLATRLDDSAGEERIVGLFCPSAVELEPVRATLERGGDFVPDGCQVTRWSFVKR